MADITGALHEAVDDLCNVDPGSMQKWISAITDAESLIAALPESRERDIAMERLTECSWWYSLAITETTVIDHQTAKKYVRKMRR